MLMDRIEREDSISAAEKEILSAPDVVVEHVPRLVQLLPNPIAVELLLVGLETTREPLEAKLAPLMRDVFRKAAKAIDVRPLVLAVSLALKIPHADLIMKCTSLFPIITELPLEIRWEHASALVGHSITFPERQYRIIAQEAMDGVDLGTKWPEVMQKVLEFLNSDDGAVRERAEKRLAALLVDLANDPFDPDPRIVYVSYRPGVREADVPPRIKAMWTALKAVLTGVKPEVLVPVLARMPSDALYQVLSKFGKLDYSYDVTVWESIVMRLMSKRPEASMRLCAATCCKLSPQTVANSSSVLPQPSQEDLRTANFLATLLADTDKDVSAKAMQRLREHIYSRSDRSPKLVPGITGTLAQILPNKFAVELLVAGLGKRDVKEQVEEKLAPFIGRLLVQRKDAGERHAVDPVFKALSVERLCPHERDIMDNEATGAFWLAPKLPQSILDKHGKELVRRSVAWNGGMQTTASAAVDKLSDATVQTETPWLVDRLEDADGGVRARALALLVRRVRHTALAPFKQIILSNSAHPRFQLVSNLDRATLEEDQSTIRALVFVLTDGAEEPNVREVATSALKKVSSEALGHEAEAIMQLWLQHPDKAVRDDARTLVLNLPPGSIKSFEAQLETLRGPPIHSDGLPDNGSKEATGGGSGLSLTNGDVGSVVNDTTPIGADDAATTANATGRSRMTLDEVRYLFGGNHHNLCPPNAS